ncbi:helix-turn-helix domain-containing protein [Streptomyces chrestomyceticus]|uniref:helix-turn-helix domain-containing protein n=1 Tax=Streptomyces chrestomyceticus TaxID=68185 RepID=UPI0019D10169|nr:helix-turn-helix domain-containing protein [Streptomyces chrestomyceticus]
MRTSEYVLGRLGVEPATESVYRALLAQPHATAAELAARTDLTEQEAERALGRLTGLALAHPSTERPGRLYAVSPRLGMDILLARQQAELAAQQQRVEESRAAAARLVSEFATHQHSAADQGVFRLAGADRISDHVREIGARAEEELQVFAAGQPYPSSAASASRRLYEDLLARGIRIRTVCLDSARNDPDAVEQAERLAAAGAEVRTAAVLPTRMVVVDRRSALVFTAGEDATEAAVSVRVPGVVTALSTLFDAVWAAAERLGPPLSRRAADGFTRQHLAALQLLAEGHTDATVARRLGVSARTARRIATDAMAGMKARSRFQAGVLAAQLGYLPAASPEVQRTA